MIVHEADRLLQYQHVCGVALFIYKALDYYKHWDTIKTLQSARCRRSGLRRWFVIFTFQPSDAVNNLGQVHSPLAQSRNVFRLDEVLSLLEVHLGANHSRC